RSQYHVQIARVKAVRDPAAASVQHGGLGLDGPVAGERPLIQTETRRKPIRPTGVPRRATRRREALRFLTAAVRLWGLQTAPVCADFDTMCLDDGSFIIDAASGIRQ